MRVAGDLLEGRYRLGAPLGRGGEATVYEALDTRLGRRVAVKVGSIELEREASLLGGLSHPGLVTVHDGGRSGENGFLVMERVPGRPLADVLIDGPLPGAQARELVAEIADALAFVHAHDLVHGDVKPGNVLIDREGHAKVGDFGVARRSDERLEVLRGTPSYASPEQLDGRQATPASDVYALGLVLLTCLTAEPPAREDLEPSLARLPEPACDMVRQMLQTDPSARPPAESVARALRAHEQQTQALQPPTVALAQRPAGRLPAWRVRVGAAVLLLLVVLVLPLVGQAGSGQGANPSVPQPTPRVSAPPVAPIARPSAPTAQPNSHRSHAHGRGKGHGRK